MSGKNPVGDQLDGKTLHERQKQVRASATYLPGPIVIAAGLRMYENIGGVLRVADVAGSARVIFVNDDVSPEWKRIERTARDSHALVKWEFWTPAQFLRQSDSLPPLIALELTTHSTSILETELPNPCALMVDGEQDGIPAPFLSRCQRAAHIPMFGVSGSMNVTHALAIALYEWRRQHSS